MVLVLLTVRWVFGWMWHYHSSCTINGAVVLDLGARVVGSLKLGRSLWTAGRVCGAVPWGVGVLFQRGSLLLRTGLLLVSGTVPGTGIGFLWAAEGGVLIDSPQGRGRGKIRVTAQTHRALTAHRSGGTEATGAGSSFP